MVTLTVLESHRFQGALFQRLHAAAVFGGHRQQRVGELEPRRFDLSWISAEVTCDLAPSFIKRLAQCLESFGSVRGTIYEVSGFQGRFSIPTRALFTGRKFMQAVRAVNTYR